MRLSTNQIFQSGLSAMQRAQSNLNYTGLQLATGERILTPSDDPSGATVSVQLSAAVNATEQYQRNIDLAQPRLEQEDVQLGTLENYLQRARELVIAGNNDTYSQADRETFASELRQLSENILALANTKDSNGEYLFAGTDSFVQPFIEDGEGDISYVGAEGEGSVREVSISSTRTISVGDTGESIFMDIPEESGRLVEALTAYENTGTLVVDEIGISDDELYDTTLEETYRIEFTDNAGTMEYTIYDSEDNVVQDADGNNIEDIAYLADTAIQFAGRSVTLSGTPEDGDSVTSRPTQYVSIFETLDAIATAFENPVTGEDGREVLSEAVEIAIANLDSSLDQVNAVRTTVGLRLNTIDTQTEFNDERIVQLETTLSDVRDLDYAEAISRYKLQEVALQAAQQTYAQVAKMSLFDFL